MLEEITAGKTKEVFGVDVELPYLLNSRKAISSSVFLLFLYQSPIKSVSLLFLS